MNSLTSLLLLAYLAIVTATPFDECGSPTGKVTRLDVSDCPDSDDTCSLKRGTNKTISITFDSTEPSTSVNAVVHGVIAGVPLPFMLPKPDGCAFGGLKCPLVKDQSYIYSHILEIRNSYPPLGVKVRWELKDEAKNDIVCVEIPCQIE